MDNQKIEEGLHILGDLHARKIEWIPTGISELDEILGGGLVRNSLMIYGGRRGSGKSTCWCQIAGSLIARNEKVLYVSGEEDLSQFAHRAIKRLAIDIKNSNLLVTDRTDIEFITAVAMKHNIDVVIIDSLPTLHHTESGGKVPVTELLEIKKQLNAAIVFIAHETKGNKIAGQEKDAHMVDQIIKADPEWTNPAIKRIRVEKNRFAPVLYDMRYRLVETGMESIGLVQNDPFLDLSKPPKVEKSKKLRVRTIRS
jgi:DNA repair protein RadA/Sms